MSQADTARLPAAGATASGAPVDLNGAMVFVTGGSGFIGSAVARALESRGAAVRLLVRPGSPRANLQGLSAELVVGNMCDRGRMQSVLRGCRYLFHVAADYRLWARHPKEIFRTNVGGVESVMTAALAAGVERIVYTSSVATLRPRRDGAPADESDPLPAAEAVGAYKQSKVAAELRVLQMVADRDLPAVIVNPSTPLGPRDVRPTPTGRIVVEAARGRMPAFVDTGLNLVHVDDVAVGHLLALEHGRIGERYILGGQDAPLRALLRTIAELSGRRAPRLRLPITPLQPLALAAEALASATGAEPFLTRDGLRMSRQRMYFRSDKAARELGYAARPYAGAVGDAIEWFVRQGYLP